MRRTEVVVSEKHDNGYFVFIRLDGLPLTYELPHISVASEEDLALVCRLAITTIADALNAPVLATEEVLAGLPKDAKLLAENDEYQGFQIVKEINREYMRCSTAQHGSYHYFENKYDEDGLLISTPHVWHFKSNGCSKTAEYLRQFTLGGVRKETTHD